MINKFSTENAELHSYKNTNQQQRTKSTEKTEMDTNIIIQDKTKDIAEFSIIRSMIYEIRGQKVMLDFDLAEMYRVKTKVLKQSVRRNIKRFPLDFMFELTKKEWDELVTNCDHMPESMKYSYVPSFAFTEQGIAMLSGLLNSDVAIETNIVIMRAFVVLRQYSLNYAEFDKKLEDFVHKTNTKFDKNDAIFKEVFKLLDELIKEKRLYENRTPIGFKQNNENNKFNIN